MTPRPSSPTLVEAETLVGSPRPRRAGASARSGSQPLLLGPYVVHGLLGEGAMGRVLSGHGLALGRPGRREADQGALLARPGRDDALPARGGGREPALAPGAGRVLGQGDDYVAMELVEGESLEARLARLERLSPAEAVRILGEVAGALDYIHGQGVVHRDVKPSNLLLLPQGGVKITDFGIAHLSWAPMTRSGELIGTPAFMAPEQIRTGDVSPATDVYALGLVAFEMLTGTRPFRGRSYAELLMRVIDAPPGVRARRSSRRCPRRGRRDGPRPREGSARALRERAPRSSRRCARLSSSTARGSAAPPAGWRGEPAAFSAAADTRSGALRRCVAPCASARAARSSAATSRFISSLSARCSVSSSARLHS